MTKKQLIIEKALELFAENGIEATSIQQITESCGISKGAFYLSFKSKDQLVLGILHHFMNDIITGVEQSVSEGQPNHILLSNFYYTVFHFHQKHANFAKIFIKEPFSSCNLELLEQFNQYNDSINDLIFSIVKRQFSEIDELMMPDLVYVILGFTKHYSELFFKIPYPIDLELLCNTLVEKTTILAKYTTTPFITPEFVYLNHTECLTPTKEQLLDILMKKMNESTDSLIRQSLELLMDDLKDAQLPEAVIQGLLKNIGDSPKNKWVVRAYELYMKNSSN
ncbi:MAG: TetR/AcrR family transcriptional regulator [Bacillus sp. (in: firmicutes)]